MIMEMDPGKVMVAMAGFAAVWGSVLVIARSVIRFAEIRANRGRPELSSETQARLERIEHAVDAVAIEVERISEAQRFTTKLLAERSGVRERPQLTD